MSQELDAPPRPDWSRPCTVLNGPWRFDFDPGDLGEKENWPQSHAFTRTIVVPYPWQSELSGIGDVEYQGVAWYQCDITVPKDIVNRRVFLVFGAVDYHAKVWVGDALVAEHEGGYTPFEAEITDLVKPGESAKVTVRAHDITDPETPTGKQTGWYTRTGGIWQTPYIEYRGLSYIRKAHITPDIDKEQAAFDCEIEARQAGSYTVAVHAVLGSIHLRTKKTVACQRGLNKVQVILPVRNPSLWSPDSPSLYETRLTLLRGETAVDAVETYFGMRKIGRGVYGGSGHEYILLNNKPIYLRGALHQSFNPKGIYTHPDDDYIRNDYAKAKEFGLNFIRIHIKIDEPRALYWADRLGILLMCDMPNFTKNTSLARKRWEDMLRAAIDRDFNHPSIFAWCDFNETWGIGDGGYSSETQQWVRDMYRLTKELDPTRLAEDNSPCLYDHTETDINSWHFYIDRYEAAAKHIAEVVEKTFPGSEFNYAKGWKQGTAPLINSEYGGVGAGSGDRDISWVFLFLTNLLRKYDKIGGYVYTELEDIEWEHNGFMNYDRSPKEYGYPAGITLAQLQHDEFPVLDCPPYQRVEAHSRVRIPVLLSHWSERKGLKVRMSVDGTTVNGLPWSNAIRPVEWDVDAKPFAVTPVNVYEFDLPGANGILNVVAEVLLNGQRCAANYCVIDARGGGDWFRPDEYAATFPVNAFSQCGFDDMPAMADDCPGKISGYKTGFFEYQLRLPRGLKAGEVKGCRLVVEAGSKADAERLDWPARRHPQDCPQTDGKTWPTDLTLSLNGVPIKHMTLGSDYADARGVLSHAAHRDHGSHGEILDIPIEGEAFTVLQKALGSASRTVTLRFEIKPDAANAGGLALYGGEMGAFPSDPALVFQLVPEAQKPEKPAKVLAAKGLPFDTIIQRGPKGHLWRFTTDDPGPNWNQPGFDDKAWRTGKSGFGTPETPGARVGTIWKTSDIWLRTNIAMPKSSRGKKIVLDLHHDEDAEIFVNGNPLLAKPGHVAEYERIVLSPEQAALFKANNLVAVHCRQTRGGQFIDLGLMVRK